MEKLLTIAIPTYNRREYLATALASIFSQYDERVEVLVSDNCSEDDTREFVLSNYSKASYFCNEQNVGMENFKRCYDRASGQYVMLLGDDDIVVEGAIKHILDFLEKNKDLTLVFLNHTSFYDEYKGFDAGMKSFLNANAAGFVTEDKKKFMKYAKYQLTFMSCVILAKKAYLTVKDPIAYLQPEFITFMHTCVELEATKEPAARLGVIFRVCIAQYILIKQHSLSWVMNAFCMTMNNVFCELAPTFGYNKNQMARIFEFFFPRVAILILGYKAKGLEWKDAFWRIGYPVYKKYPLAWVTVIPAALVPSPLAKLARKLLHLLKGKK